MEQLNIFDNVEVTSTTSSVQTDRAYMNTVGTTGFRFSVGTNVVFGFGHNMAVYEVIEEQGEMVNVRFTGNGYRNSLQGLEMTVPGEQIKGIVDGEDLIQLPQKRPATLDLEFYRNRAALMLDDIASDRDKLLDFLTYYLLVSPSAIANSSINYVWNRLLENIVDSSVKYRIFSLSNYAQKHDFHNLFFRMAHTGAITVEFGLEEDSEKVEFNVTDIITRFHEMLDKFTKTPIEQLSHFELMVFYRKHGYLLTYKAGTDEWYFQHPNSTKSIPVKRQADLYNVERFIGLYENKFIKRTFVSSFTEGTLDLFESEIKPPSLEGFVVPSGTIVRLTSTYGFTSYKVIEDNGKHVKLHTEDDEDNVLVVSSKLMSYCYPYENRLLSVPLPRFNRPSSLTIETIIKRDTHYYHELSDKEFKDAAVYQAACSDDSWPKVFRALMEDDEPYAKELIKSSTAGLSSTNFRFDSKGKVKELEYGLRGQSRNITLDSNEIVKHLNKMFYNAANYSFNRLSIAELKLAYYVRGYSLTYHTVKDEFVLSKGIYSLDVKEGRALLNDFEKTIKVFESEKTI